MNRLMELRKSFKKAIIPFVLIFCGFVAQGFGAENEKYQLGSGDHGLLMNKIESAPELGGLSHYWRVERLPALGDNVFGIIGYPGQNRANGTHRGNDAYRPPFSESDTVDSLLLTCSGDANFLESFWTPNGLSSHVILARDGTVFIHANPLRGEKGQMAGKWNARSLEVAFIHKGEQVLSIPQQQAIQNLLGIFGKESQKIQIKKCGSIWEAKQLDNIPGFESGHVHNMDAVREFLGLSPLTLE